VRSGGECSVVSLTLMPQPLNYSAIYSTSSSSHERDLKRIQYNEPWYSYDIGIVHFLSMSTEHNFTTGSKQYLFIENDLKSVNKSITPWILFSGHRSMYVDSDQVRMRIDIAEATVMKAVVSSAARTEKIRVKRAHPDLTWL
jgi:DNA-binding LytR/AlgR family response regulator